MYSKCTDMYHLCVIQGWGGVGYLLTIPLPVQVPRQGVDTVKWAWPLHSGVLAFPSSTCRGCGCQ